VEPKKSFHVSISNVAFQCCLRDIQIPQLNENILNSFQLVILCEEVLEFEHVELGCM
jgi:hypothetical protein